MFERIEVASPSRPWTTALAFMVNATFITLGILVPMVKPDHLPALNFRTVTPPYSVAPAEAARQPQPRAHESSAALNDGVFREPSSIPKHTDTSADPDLGRPPVDPVFGNRFSDPSAIPLTGLPLGPSPNPPALSRPTPKPTASKPLVVSHLDEGMLIRRVQPVYPVIAIASRAEGTVVLSALISAKGEIEHLQVVDGSPLLAQAALEAVRQWRYRPYILNGSPIEVQTQIVVKFNLQH